MKGGKQDVKERVKGRKCMVKGGPSESKGADEDKGRELTSSGVTGL